MRPRAVLLDFDGVVVASLPVHLRAWSEAAAQVFGRPLESPETLAGHATRTIAGIVAKKLGDPSLAATLVRVKEELLAQKFGDVPLVNGARAFIESLGQLGIPHGIASNSPGAFVRGVVAAAGLEVRDIICGDEVSRGKPHPDIFWQLANRLRIDPTERPSVAVFEDSAHGLKAARSAGMVPLGVATERSPRVLLDAGAVAVCRDLADAMSRRWLEALPSQQSDGVTAG